jgi:hypothetical protein
MSEEIITLSGRKEMPNRQKMKSDYTVSSLHITSFWGGAENGRMFQLTLNDDHIQIHEDVAKELVRTLLEHLL